MQLKTRSKVSESAFIAKPARIMAILHLCLVFTIICWVGSWPFLGEMLEYKRQMFHFQTVLGGGELIERTYATQQEVLAKIDRYKVKFNSLPQEKKSYLLNAYNDAQELQRERGFMTQLNDSVEFVFVKSSPWLRAWLLFSVIAAILLLKKSLGAPYAICILPLIIAFWWMQLGPNISLSKSDALYPTEKYLLTHYSANPFSSSISQQQKQLTQAWEGYLSSEWSIDGDVEDGEWRFQLARLELALEERKDREASTSGFLLCLLLIWNICFAFVAYYWRVSARAEVSFC